jgi:hypothetical protein
MNEHILGGSNAIFEIFVKVDRHVQLMTCSHWRRAETHTQACRLFERHMIRYAVLDIGLHKCILGECAFSRVVSVRSHDEAKDPVTNFPFFHVAVSSLFDHA